MLHMVQTLQEHVVLQDFADFGHGSGTMANELLDDYEEGNWTPASAVGTISNNRRRI